MSGIKCRNWCFTSYAEERPIFPAAKYVISQREKCPTTGRLHWQGFVAFPNPRRMKSIKEMVGDETIHLEICRDAKASIQYCQKLETAIPGTVEEIGTPPVDVREPVWWQTIPIAELWEQEPEWMLRHYAGVNAYHKTKKTRQVCRPKPEVVILYGPPGTGKSTKARNCEDFYVKPSGDFWEGYHGQKRVIFDDFYGGEKYSDILRWCSENPIRVPIKGSSIDLAATEFYFTSNVEYTKWWKVDDLSAFERRVTDIVFMDQPVNKS